ncbi:MAG: aromatic amino acid lyase [Thermoleophilia bacterium]
MILTGKDLTLAEVVAVARSSAQVEFTAGAVEAMTAARACADAVRESGASVYGLTTGLGVHKTVRLAGDDASFDWRQIGESRAGQGRPAPPDVVRAAMLVLANQMAGGSTCVRPMLAEKLLAALNGDERPCVHSLGSLGAADLAPMADIAHHVFSGVDLEPGEGLALISTSAFGTASAALAMADAVRLLDASDVAAALALEGFAANLSPLHPAVEEARPDPVLARTLARLRELLDGSYLWQEGAARNLQDPLTFRGVGPIQAAARGAFEHALAVLAGELNCAQGNPLVSADLQCVVSAAAYEVVALAASVDYMRVALASALTSASERCVKLLDALWSGLPTGLLADGGPDLGLSVLAITAQALAAEAGTLAQPVSFMVASTSGAEGIEDRATLLPLSARRLAEQVEVAEVLIGVELLIAAQAVDVRGRLPLGRGTARAHRRIRQLVATFEAGAAPQLNAEPVRQLVRAGVFDAR